MYAEARGVWGYAPPEKLVELDVVRWLLKAILGPTTSLLIFALVLAWYQDSDSLHVCTHGDKCPSVVSSPLRTT